ncbi:BirA family biotin operon repressor/biotin-[acetyl-CoA-carboxylase] ligase [Prosthecobacter fusiformis]|uniref:biotin--[biotin carboxyl-carrier protein] ligase n=1 Tax=Prosthecobacter fusiformis TaxID=48464 RepID=A0A4R7S0R3_9BACT|nr:biotin--[acetyl-CoA-carboxylase] ligase [Prosthecobacter fusiformis]TDU70755.1 BirA family biotin operon repressor/biotin-[acetyl-CoA-carboxylase] ligase [Prosthecobacter fusiformis]
MSMDAAWIQSECAAHELPWRVRVEEEIPSTSDALRTAATQGESHGAVVFAESQTAGRGRRENRWVTPRGLDLMFSILLRPTEPVALWPRLTTLAALAICRAIEEELPLQPEIKWPNDIYIEGRKVAGLLAEVVTTPQGMALVLGIGLNVNSREFPPALADTATSLILALPPNVQIRELDRPSLAVRLLRELDAQFQHLSVGFLDAVSQVRLRSWLVGKQIRATVDSQEIFGRALDINQEGHLILALPDGSLKTLTSADGVRQVVSA